MSNFLNQKHALAKLRVELEGKKRKLYQYYKSFRYLAQNCRNKKEKKKGKLIPQSKFEVLAGRVIRYRVKEKECVCV